MRFAKVVALLWLSLVAVAGSTNLNNFQSYIGTACNLLTGANCNSAQIVLALSNDQPVLPAYIPGLAVVRLDPSQIEEISANTFVDHASVQLVYTMDQISTKSAESFGIGLDVPFADAVLSASSSYSNCVRSMYQEQGEQILASSTISKSTATITIKPGEEKRLRLDADFARDVKSLPTVLPRGNDTALMQFFNFFQNYGTHYVTQVTIGGLLYQSVQINKREVETQKMTNTDLTTSVGYILDIRVGSKQSESLVKDISSFSSQSSVVAIGGSDSLLDDVYKWADSVKASPEVIETKLEPISTAVRPFFPEVAAAIDEAITTLMSSCKTPDDNVCSGSGWCSLPEQECMCAPSKHGSVCQYTSCDTVTCGVDDQNNRLYCDETTGACCEYGKFGANCDMKCGNWIQRDPMYNGSYIQYYTFDHGTCACYKFYYPAFPDVQFDESNSEKTWTFIESPKDLCDETVCNDMCCHYFTVLSCNLGECPYAQSSEFEKGRQNTKVNFEKL